MRDGFSLNDAIVQAKQIDEQCKAARFYQEALDHVARQGFANARFDVNSEEGLDVIEEFYSDSELEDGQKIAGVNQADRLIQDIQQGLQRSVRAVN